MVKKIFFIGIFLIALLYRFPNLQTPFWVDEFSTARNSMLVLREGLGVFSQRNEFFEHHNVTQHFLVATFFKVLGVSESSARLPSVLFGSLVPVFVYLVARKLFDRNTAIVATIFTLFSYFEITWARQARSYMLLQLIILISIWLYSSLIKKFTVPRFTIFAVFIALGWLTHTSFVLFIAALVLHFIYLCFHWNFFNKESLKRFSPYIIFFAILLVLLSLNNNFQAILGGLAQAIKVHPNNVWYYHSFMWREQTLISFLAVVGLMLNALKYRKGTFLVAVPIACYLFFLCFLFPPYVTRYILPVFPLILILAGYAVSTIATALHPKFSLVIVLIITLFIVGNGDTFVVKPKKFYSVNHDMREIALIDYDQVYNLIKQKTGTEVSKTAIIDTWPDRARWYVGYDNPNVYYFHWGKETGNVNGLDMATVFTVKQDEKYLPDFKNPSIRFIGSLDDLKLVLAKYPQGFIWIDDTSLPQDVISFAKTSMKQELYLDHYTLDDNPYSIWPGTLYSWGFD